MKAIWKKKVPKVLFFAAPFHVMDTFITQNSSCGCYDIIEMASTRTQIVFSF